MTNWSFPDTTNLTADAVDQLRQMLEPLTQLKHQSAARWATAAHDAVTGTSQAAAPVPLAEVPLAERAFIREYFTREYSAAVSVGSPAADWCRELIWCVDMTGAYERAQFDVLSADIRTVPTDLVGDTTGIPPWSRTSG